MPDDVDPPVGWVVIGIDGSKRDPHVATWAAGEAERRGCGLCVFLAVRPFASEPGIDDKRAAELVESGESVAQVATESLRAEHPKLPICSMVRFEHPISALVRLSVRASVLVVGNRRLGPVGALVLGSVTRGVVAHARCPVVLVGDLVAAPDGPVVVGVEPDRVEADVLHFAFSQAQQRGVMLCMVWATMAPDCLFQNRGVSTGAIYDSIAEERAIEVQMVAQKWSDRFPGVQVEVRVVRRNPVEALTLAAATACLVVLGNRANGALDTMLLGPVTRGVLHNAPAVAIVRSEQHRLSREHPLSI